jgi:predicted unusual protein kinase regulating ubiquinone biosynthesis (AarF/ABC1/UbiB family)
LDGTPVVVKVQYPNTEQFWQLDFACVISVYNIICPGMAQMWEEFRNTVKDEFDYSHEARNLRRMCNDVRDRFAGVQFPEPYDVHHPNLPVAWKADGKGLVTKRVLVMDMMKGETLASIGQTIGEDYARSQGKSLTELKAEMKEKMKDPVFVKALMRKGPTKSQMALYQTCVVARDGVRNVVAASYNGTMGWLGNRIPYEWSPLPLNGPKLMQQLYDVHAFQLFSIGVVNTDPHAGNIMLDKLTGSMSLIDYGQLKHISENGRSHFARMLIALDDGDRAKMRDSWVAMGNTVDDPRTGERNPEWLIEAILQLYFGGSAGVLHCLKAFGFETFAQLVGPEVQQYIDPRTVSYAPEFWDMLRCFACLKGVADTFGVGGASQASIMRLACERHLQLRC